MKTIIALLTSGLLAGCMTSETTPTTYKARIYIPPINAIACEYDSVQVREEREEYYSPEVAKKMDGCFYPYPEPKRWEAYDVHHRTIGRFSWEPGALNSDSASRAAQFFHPNNTEGPYEPEWALRTSFVNGGSDAERIYEQWHFRKADAPNEQNFKSHRLITYDRAKGGFQVSTLGHGLEIFIIE